MDSSEVNRLAYYFDNLYLLKDDQGIQYVESIFHKLPSRQEYPDYYKIITRPVSLHKVGTKLKSGKYESVSGFLRDLAQMTWNARYYNAEGSPIYEYATMLEDHLRQTVVPALKREVDSSIEFPNLGSFEDEADKERTPLDERGVYKRGRPPIIDKPHEQRIKNMIRALKKVVDPADANKFLYNLFERLPHEYYSSATRPVSLLDVRSRIKQRKYPDVGTFLSDMKTFFTNVKKFYGRKDKEMHDYAISLESAFRDISQEELARPEEEYSMSQDGQARIPLDMIELKGEAYRIGDWVLLRNPNQGAKPIVAQIFRIWSTPGNDRKWINVCWYYRPEQTVHRVDRLFFDNEVFKTGQYRDHAVEDIVGPCYVAYFTRYQRGDPAVDFKGPLFICEFRYNDSDKAFNKIRTWKACLPDEVRGHEDPIHPLPDLRIMTKRPSTLSHMLPPNATDTMGIPEPTIGSVNAPPLIGNVYMRPPAVEDDLAQYSTSPQRTHLRTLRIIDHNGAPMRLPIYGPGGNASSSVSAPIAPSVVGTPNPRPVGRPPLNHHRPLPSPYGQVSGCNTFTMSPELTDQLNVFTTDGLAKMDIKNNMRRFQGSVDPQMLGEHSDWPVIWYRGAPNKIAYKVMPSLPEEHLHLMKRKIDDPDHASNVIVGRKFPKLGHSVKYLAWKLREKNSD